MIKLLKGFTDVNEIPKTSTEIIEFFRTFKSKLEGKVHEQELKELEVRILKKDFNLYTIHDDIILQFD